MKHIFALLFTTVLVLAFPASALAEGQAKPKATKRGPVFHLVAFKFKADATPAQIQQVEAAFAALPGKIPFIKSYKAGTNISPEKFNKGFTHGFVLKFKNASDRDAYLVHPAHKAFGGLVGPVVDDVFVLDFQASK